MAGYKVQQQRISHGGKSYHFVSYDSQPANERRGQEAVPPMWYLMRAGKRWPVMPQVVGQPEPDTVRALGTWLLKGGPNGG